MRINTRTRVRETERKRIQNDCMQGLEGTSQCQWAWPAPLGYGPPRWPLPIDLGAPFKPRLWLLAFGHVSRAGLGTTLESWLCNHAHYGCPQLLVHPPSCCKNAQHTYKCVSRLEMCHQVPAWILGSPIAVYTCIMLIRVRRSFCLSQNRCLCS